MRGGLLIIRRRFCTVGSWICRGSRVAGRVRAQSAAVVVGGFQVGDEDPHHRSAARMWIAKTGYIAGFSSPNWPAFLVRLRSSTKEGRQGVEVGGEIRVRTAKLPKSLYDALLVGVGEFKSRPT
jgi:hypothetical protein